MLKRLIVWHLNSWTSTNLDRSRLSRSLRRSVVKEKQNYDGLTLSLSPLASAQTKVDSWRWPEGLGHVHAILWPRNTSHAGAADTGFLLPHMAGWCVFWWLHWCDWPTRLLPRPGAIQAPPGLHARLHRHAPGTDWCRNLPQESLLTKLTHCWPALSYWGPTEVTL